MESLKKLISKLEKAKIRLNIASKEVLNLENRVKSWKDRKIRISEHAYERYSERIEDIPRNKIKEILLNKQLKTMVDTLGDGIYPVNNFKVVVRNKIIITILNDE